jgi:hypothetical protein
VAASPEGDFTVSLQASWWRAAALAPEAAAEREGPRSATDPAAYAVSRDRLGVPYTVEGTFVAAGAGLLQLEMAVPTAKRAFLEGLFKSWVQGARHPPRAASAR